MAEIEVKLRGPMDRGLGFTDSLISDLEAVGSVEVADLIEKRWQPTAEEIERALVIMLTTKELLVPVVKASWRWVQSKRRKNEPGERHVKVIHGASGEVLAEVEVGDPEPEAEG